MAIQRICSVDDCSKPLCARGYCKTHYGRNYRNGSPLICSYVKTTTIKGATKMPEYNIWGHIKDRCNNPSSDAYIHYGGRGISICKEWLESFDLFYAHIGRRPSRRHTLDRIDNEKGYEPGNVRWTDWQTQANNKRNNVWITANGKRMTVAQWARYLGANPITIHSRLAKGWSKHRAVTVPIIPSLRSPRPKPAPVL